MICRRIDLQAYCIQRFASDNPLTPPPTPPQSAVFNAQDALQAIAHVLIHGCQGWDVKVQPIRQEERLREDVVRRPESFRERVRENRSADQICSILHAKVREVVAPESPGLIRPNAQYFCLFVPTQNDAIRHELFFHWSINCYEILLAEVKVAFIPFPHRRVKEKTPS